MSWKQSKAEDTRLERTLCQDRVGLTKIQDQSQLRDKTRKVIALLILF